MKAEVLVYETKEDYAYDVPAYAEEYYSITEAIEDKKRVVRKIKTINSMRDSGDPREFIGFRILDSLGQEKWKLPSEPVNIKALQEKRARMERSKKAELAEKLRNMQKS
jgi:hypothetical protein